MGKKIKLCLLGNSGCGKSSIILRIIEKSFKQLPSTVGIDFKSEKKKINNEEVNVEIWDTSGQDRFRSVACNFFKTADGIFLVYDITNQQSFKDLDYWILQLNQNLSQQVPKVLLANKSDLKQNQSAEIQKKLKKICEQNKFMFFKVSAKKGTNITTAYESLLDESYKYVSKKVKVESSILIPEKPRKKEGCC